MSGKCRCHARHVAGVGYLLPYNFHVQKASRCPDAHFQVVSHLHLTVMLAALFLPLWACELRAVCGGGQPAGRLGMGPLGVASPVICQAASHGPVRFTSPATPVVRCYLWGHLIVGCPPLVFFLH